MYTKIGGKWIKNKKIVTEYGLVYDYFGSSVALSGSTGVIVTPYGG